MRRILLLVACMAAASSALAQAPDFGGNAQRKAIKKLSFMVGEWAGGGWAEVQGERHSFQGTETILPKCEGVILSLEGNHYVEAGGRKIPVHNAFGTLRFDEKTGKYHMRSHLANGLESEFEFTATPNGYTWKMKHPTWCDMVYTAVFTKDTWTEYGEAVKDGKKVRVYEMNMKRANVK